LEGSRGDYYSCSHPLERKKQLEGTGGVDGRLRSQSKREKSKKETCQGEEGERERERARERSISKRD